MNSTRKYLSIAICFLESTLLSGAVLGWASLVYVLQEDGLFAHLCKNEQGESIGNYTHFEANTTTGFNVQNMTIFAGHAKPNRCPEQKVALSAPYTTAMFIWGTSLFPIGAFFDRFGLRITRTLIAITGAAAYLQLAFASPEREWLVTSAGVCLGLSSGSIIMTNAHVALLAGPKASTVTALYNAGLSTSFTYQIVKMAYDQGISRRDSLLFIASLWSMVLFSSWFLLPRFKVRPPNMNTHIEEVKQQNGRIAFEEEKEVEQIDPSNHLIVRNGPDINPIQPHDIQKSNPNTTKIPLMKQNISTLDEHGSESRRHFLLSKTYILFLYWYCVSYLRASLTIVAYDSWMTVAVKGDTDKVSYFTDVMAYGILVGTATTPLTGIITDCMRVRFGSEPRGAYTAMIPALTLGSILIILISLPIFVFSEVGIYCLVIVLAVAKPCFLTSADSFLALLCPVKFFGLVYGITSFISGLTGSLMYPFLLWSAESGFSPMNGFLLAMTIPILLLPIKLFYDRWKTIKKSLYHL